MSQAKILFSIFILIITSCFAPVVSAQSTSGSVQGEIKDNDGQPLPGVMVSATGENGIKSAITDVNGKFTIGDLTPGTYDIEAELSGFGNDEKKGLEVAAGTPTEVSFTMGPSNIQELMVVTASRVETSLINAPATMTVLTSTDIQESPAQNYGDLLRSVPGLNVIQMSARDINITSRQTTSTLATSQLALLDGRTIYQDFFGFILWDFLPVNFNEIKQIEVIRGPASAVWGANAQTGVVNIITKSPREMAGTSITLSGGVFDRNVDGGPDIGNGTSFGANVTHAQVINDQWSYKLSAGYFDSDPLARPAGLIPRETIPNTNIPTGGFPYSAVGFVNDGSQQPKFDIRFDQELSRDSKLTYAGGVAGTSGIIHTGIGPFDIDNGSALSYGKVNYNRGNFKLNFFSNFLDGEATNLLTRGADGRPIDFKFKTQTYDIEAADSILLGGMHMVSFGGNFRRNNFDLSLAPLGDNRNEVGAYVQDEIFTDHFRLVIGGRVDKFDVIDHAVFSPRLTFMYKPRPEHVFRVSYNRAFRSPSLINNFLDVNIITATLDLRPFGAPIPVFPIITHAFGNQNLKEESLTAYEVGYTGQFGKSTVSASYYINDNDENINFVATGAYSTQNPPPGWPLPPQIIGFLASQGFVFPSTFTYLNLGPLRNQGIELSLDQGINDRFHCFVNYSYQKDPEILNNKDGLDFPASEVIFAPNNRFNAGLNYDDRRYLSSISVNYAGDAFWTDVLDARFFGPTDAYTMVNVSFGVHLMNNHVTTTLKINNLLNEQIQQHIFGDVLKRSIVGEVRFDL